MKTEKGINEIPVIKKLNEVFEFKEEDGIINYFYAINDPKKFRVAELEMMLKLEKIGNPKCEILYDFRVQTETKYASWKYSLWNSFILIFENKFVTKENSLLETEVSVPMYEAIFWIRLLKE